jgi:hypothetical protein
LCTPLTVLPGPLPAFISKPTRLSFQVSIACPPSKFDPLTKVLKLVLYLQCSPWVLGHSRDLRSDTEPKPTDYDVLTIPDNWLGCPSQTVW